MSKGGSTRMPQIPDGGMRFPPIQDGFMPRPSPPFMRPPSTDTLFALCKGHGKV